MNGGFIIINRKEMKLTLGVNPVAVVTPHNSQNRYLLSVLRSEKGETR